MKLSQYRDYFKNIYNWTESISIGKIDNNKDIAICFYNSKRQLAYTNVLGGIKNKSTNVKPITILIRCGKNQDTAEELANLIYDFFNERSFFIDKKRVFTIMLYDEPINLGTDEKNVYEYSIELNFYERRI